MQQHCHSSPYSLMAPQIMLRGIRPALEQAKNDLFRDIHFSLSNKKKSEFFFLRLAIPRISAIYERLYDDVGVAYIDMNMCVWCLTLFQSCLTTICKRIFKLTLNVFKKFINFILKKAKMNHLFLLIKKNCIKHSWSSSFLVINLSQTQHLTYSVKRGCFWARL